MRNPKRIDVIIEELRSLWKTNSDLRFCQMFMNIVNSPDPFYMEDDYFLKCIKDYKEYMEDIMKKETEKHKHVK